ncbi:MAG: porphobilinogen synthase, partial [Steroidobacteraceae bacterium]
MPFPQQRPRRTRQSDAWRRMVRETRLSADALIYPMFVVPGRGVRHPVESMPGICQLSVDEAVKEARAAAAAGVPAVLLF